MRVCRARMRSRSAAPMLRAWGRSKTVRRRRFCGVSAAVTRGAPAICGTPTTPWGASSAASNASASAAPRTSSHHRWTTTEPGTPPGSESGERGCRRGRNVPVWSGSMTAQFAALSHPSRRGSEGRCPIPPAAAVVTRKGFAAPSTDMRLQSATDRASPVVMRVSGSEPPQWRCDSVWGLYDQRLITSSLCRTVRGPVPTP
jgi:hypothetical protein